MDGPNKEGRIRVAAELPIVVLKVAPAIGAVLSVTALAPAKLAAEAGAERVIAPAQARSAAREVAAAPSRASIAVVARRAARASAAARAGEAQEAAGPAEAAVDDGDKSKVSSVGWKIKLPG